MKKRGVVRSGFVLLLALFGMACGEPTLVLDPHAAAVGWSSYGGDPGGRRYSPLDDITRDNVSRLKVAWIHRTGELPDSRGPHRSTLASEVTPLLVDGTLYLCTPYNRILALDPETGEERWRFDPEISLEGHYANGLVCRGVAYWRDPGAVGEASCSRRVFSATNDARLLSVDARTGRPCKDFGKGGFVDLNPGVGPQEWRGEYQVTSPPAVGRDVVVVGAAVSDNRRIDAPSGVVRAYDARTGALRWAWDLSPPSAALPGSPYPRSDAGYVLGTPNVWAPMSVDLERDLLFLPTGNPAPDYYRGGREDIDYYGSSVVALRLSTGKVVWRFQTVHHDLWDFDVPAQPTLFDLERDGESIPAVAQPTKMGLVFILHRETGEPLFDVEERPVPQVHAKDERVSPTQPFPVKPPPLVRTSLAPEDAWGITPWDRGACRDLIAGLRFDGMYTAPTEQGTLMVPGNAGGVNWGGLAVDPVAQRIVVNVQDIPWSVRLIPREDAPEEIEGSELALMRGTPFKMERRMLVSPLGLPCNGPPWGSLIAIDLRSGDIAWREPLGTIRDLTPLPLPLRWGVPNLGGPLLTGGLVFIGAALDHYLRAFDAETGEEIWRGRLPAGGQATPMTYRARRGGRQFVVIAATGYGRIGEEFVSDAIVAYALE